MAADSDAHQIHALTEAARRGGVGSRITPQTRDLNRRPLAGEELRHLDGLVLDPPRAGALNQIAAPSGELSGSANGVCRRLRNFFENRLKNRDVELVRIDEADHASLSPNDGDVTEV